MRETKGRNHFPYESVNLELMLKMLLQPTLNIDGLLVWNETTKQKSPTCTGERLSLSLGGANKCTLVTI